MMILDELWNGTASPCEHRYEANSAYDLVSRRISAQVNLLRQNASKRQRKVWEAYERDLAERKSGTAGRIFSGHPLRREIYDGCAVGAVRGV